MADLWIQVSRQEIQYDNQVTYVLVDVRFRVISESCGTVS